VELKYTINRTLWIIFCFSKGWKFRCTQIYFYY